MEKLNAGALVIYRTKPALITALDGDKIEIKTASGDSKRVRLKDIEFVHPGNGSISQFPLPMPPEPDLNEAVELMDGETLSFADFTELLFGKYAPAECCAAYQILPRKTRMPSPPVWLRSQKRRTPERPVRNSLNA